MDLQIAFNKGAEAVVAFPSFTAGNTKGLQLDNTDWAQNTSHDLFYQGSKVGEFQRSSSGRLTKSADYSIDSHGTLNTAKDYVDALTTASTFSDEPVETPHTWRPRLNGSSRYGWAVSGALYNTTTGVGYRFYTHTDDVKKIEDTMSTSYQYWLQYPVTFLDKSGAVLGTFTINDQITASVASPM